MEQSQVLSLVMENLINLSKPVRVFLFLKYLTIF